MVNIKAIYIEVGRAIRNRRTELGLTQEQLAERVDLTRTSISHIEAGEHRILIHSLYLIAEALGVTPDTLLVLPSGREPESFCRVCAMDLKEIYGYLGSNLLKADHIVKSIGERGEGRSIDNGLCICPNCREVLKSNPGLSEEKLSDQIKRTQRSSSRKLSLNT